MGRLRGVSGRGAGGGKPAGGATFRHVCGGRVDDAGAQASDPVHRLNGLFTDRVPRPFLKGDLTPAHRRRREAPRVACCPWGQRLRASTVSDAARRALESGHLELPGR